ncbi:unnamed protein product [Rhodiola kirilowii]
MTLDLKQCVAGVLTLSMFVMLGNMVKKDNFDYMVDTEFPNTSSLEKSDKHHPGIKLSEKTTTTVGEKLWKKDEDPLQPCWKKHLPNEKQQSRGFIKFSLANGPEFHHSQVSNAVVVAYYLGATLVLPDIKGNKADDKMKFDEIYDAKKFIQSLSGVINVMKKQPAESPHAGHPVVKVPNRVSTDYIKTHIEPKFRANGNLNIVTYFPAVNMRKENKSNELDTIACLAMFGSLHLRPEVEELVDSMVEKLRVFSDKPDGRFISLDLRVEMLDKKGCRSSEDNTRKSCYNAVETSQFLKNIGVSKDTTIYLTQTVWHNSLDALRSSFPKLYTKADLMPADKKQIKMLGKSSEYEKIIDFYICTESDVFVPAISGFFYANVVGKRIAACKTQILVPSQISNTSPTSASEYISPYVLRRNHFAYSCFC